jgi:hypothetical protein
MLAIETVHHRLLAMRTLHDVEVRMETSFPMLDWSVLIAGIRIPVGLAVWKSLIRVLF